MHLGDMTECMCMPVNVTYAINLNHLSGACMCAFGFQLLLLNNSMGLLAYIVRRIPLCRMESWTQYGLPCCLKPAYACLQFEVVSQLTTGT